MIEFLAVQVRLDRITLEQIEVKFGVDARNQVEAKLNEQ
jgi:hypothetical protein